MNRFMLKENLRKLIPAIKGPWFVGDGALLGIIREGDLISWDDYIDLYFLPGTYIDEKILHESGLAQQKYYMDTKIYNPNGLALKGFEGSPWHEYLRYFRTVHRKDGMNKAETMRLAAESYKEEKIVPLFTKPYIDIFFLDDTLSLPEWDIYFNEEDLECVSNSSLGFEVKVPIDAESILERQYGSTWRTPDPHWRYF